MIRKLVVALGVLMLTAMCVTILAARATPRDTAGTTPTSAIADAGACPPDSTPSGPACIDRYEASVWETTDAGLIKKIRNGTATLRDMSRAGAIQRGTTDNVNDYDAAGCPATGNGCTRVYAVSIPGVKPSANLTWFQAAAALRNAGKRLPTNAEWQAAALGTPEPHQFGPSETPCVVNATGSGPTGTSGCVSDVGASDMVGNVNEWVADWLPAAATDSFVPMFSPQFDGANGLKGASDTAGPGALLRGGYYLGGGVFNIVGGATPYGWGPATGFRGIR